ncbi:hypothetical protein OIU76_015729 [Salix suchowensis]|nr:hypothetical protein OIU76_015729 [Salix suchowensis]
MESFTAEDLSTIGGIATVSLLHSFIPTHWLPFSIVGRAQKWTLSRTLLVTAFGAVLHVLSTSLLGITAITMANTIAGEETVHKLASLLLIILGSCYMILFLSGKGGHSHSHNQPMEKMAVAGLVLVPALSPCATTLPVFLAVGNSSSMMVLAIIVLLFRYHCYVHSAIVWISLCEFYWYRCLIDRHQVQNNFSLWVYLLFLYSFYGYMKSLKIKPYYLKSHSDGLLRLCLFLYQIWVVRI